MEFKWRSRCGKGASKFNCEALARSVLSSVIEQTSPPSGVPPNFGAIAEFLPKAAAAQSCKNSKTDQSCGPNIMWAQLGFETPHGEHGELRFRLRLQRGHGYKITCTQRLRIAT